MTLAANEKSFFNGPLTGLTVTNGGSGYTTASVIITGGGGTGATADATISAGVVTGLVLTNPGANYSSAQTVTIIGDGTGATATADPITISIYPIAIQDEMGESFPDVTACSGFSWMELPFYLRLVARLPYKSSPGSSHRACPAKRSRCYSTRIIGRWHSNLEDHPKWC